MGFEKDHLKTLSLDQMTHLGTSNKTCDVIFDVLFLTHFLFTSPTCHRM